MLILTLLLEPCKWPRRGRNVIFFLWQRQRYKTDLFLCRCVCVGSVIPYCQNTNYTQKCGRTHFTVAYADWLIIALRWLVKAHHPGYFWPITESSKKKKEKVRQLISFHRNIIFWHRRRNSRGPFSHYTRELNSTQRPKVTGLFHLLYKQKQRI